MDDFYDKENDNSISRSLSSQVNISSGNVLKSKNSCTVVNQNSLGDLQSGSPKKIQIQKSLMNMEKDYTKLEKQLEDLILRNRKLSDESYHLEVDLEVKMKTIEELNERLLGYEKAFQSLQGEFLKNKELYMREIKCYKDVIEDLHQKINKLTFDLESREFSDKAFSNLQESYGNLLREHKVLQSNLDLEKNSKVVLLDQVERLSTIISQRENVSSGSFDVDSNLQNNSFEENFDISYNNVQLETSHNITDEDEDSAQMVSYLADDLKNNHSSPIKNTSDDSVELSSNFQFPPSSMSFATAPYNPSSNGVFKEKAAVPRESPHNIASNKLADRKRKGQSLPAELKTNIVSDKDEFVLSPFKLGNPDSSNSEADISITRNVKRYSTTKPTHTRYNSHDILPIKVEFEPMEGNLRSISAPVRDRESKLEEFHEFPEDEPKSRSSERECAFMSLTGAPANNELLSNRNSLATNSSSRSASWIVENPFTNEMTRQEIMKLKFELQSLKLHNEKLLSYIGFELQKQKKNIKRLSSKKSLNNLYSNKDIEYSDAKLIEKSRRMLIQKKRVLRSVSINSILSKNYPSQHGFLAKGLYGFPGTSFADKRSQIYDSDDEEDEDDYGFLNHDDKFCKRIFSHGLYTYLNFDDIDEESFSKSEDKMHNNLKKFKSQTFALRKNRPQMASDNEYYDSEEDGYERNEEDDNEEEGELEDSSSDAHYSHNVLGHIKGLIFKNFFPNKNQNDEEKLVDEVLKYKFFTIAIGIMIVGLKLSHNTNNTIMN